MQTALRGRGIFAAEWGPCQADGLRTMGCGGCVAADALRRMRCGGCVAACVAAGPAALLGGSSDARGECVSGAFLPRRSVLAGRPGRVSLPRESCHFGGPGHDGAASGVPVPDGGPGLRGPLPALPPGTQGGSPSGPGARADRGGAQMGGHRSDSPGRRGSGPQLSLRAGLPGTGARVYAPDRPSRRPAGVDTPIPTDHGEARHPLRGVHPPRTPHRIPVLLGRARRVPGAGMVRAALLHLGMESRGP